MFDAMVTIVGCDNYHGSRHAPRGSACLAPSSTRAPSPRPLQGARRHRPRGLRGRGANAAGKMSDEDLLDLASTPALERARCGGQYTANTMAMDPSSSASRRWARPALRPSTAAGRGMLPCRQTRHGVARARPNTERILTREAFENGIAAGAATGGSTNLVLHLLAIAREVGVPLDIDDFDPASNRTLIIADLKPGGRHTAVDVDRAGGSRLLGKRLLDAGLIDGNQLTTTGRTLAEEVEDAEETPGQDVIVPVEEPLRPRVGSLSSRATSRQRAAWSRSQATPAWSTQALRASSTRGDAMKAVQAGEITENDVVVIRYEVRRAGPECARCSSPRPRRRAQARPSPS